MGKKTVRGHDIANRFVYSLKQQPLWLLFQTVDNRPLFGGGCLFSV